MSDNTKIEWADATVNAVNGCSVVSPGCTNCYAMRLAGTRMKHHPSRAGLTQESKAGPVWTGEVRLNETALLDPLKWKRPRRIFWNAHGDLFHDSVPGEWIDRVFAVCALTPQHTHMILTKRSARMREYLARPAVEVRVGLEALGIAMETKAARRMSKVGAGVKIKGSDINPGALAIWPLPNVWLGVSVEDQTRADERIPDLLATPAAVRFISAEPLLGPVDLSKVPWHVAGYSMEGALPDPTESDDFRFWHHEAQGIRWVIVGGESGPGARPMHPNWVISLRDQCEAAGVPFLFKQWGEFLPVHVETVTHAGIEFRKIGKKAAGRRLHGIEHNGFPEAPHG